MPALQPAAAWHAAAHGESADAMPAPMRGVQKTSSEAGLSLCPAEAGPQHAMHPCRGMGKRRMQQIQPN